MRFSILLLLALSLFWPFASFAQSKDAALALSVDPGVESILQGKSTNIVPKKEVPIKSTVKSDATGRSQLIFPDDATVTICPNTEVLLAEFMDIPTEENIVLDMAVGLMRVITGDASKRNPAAFTVNTPQATIGIRGTMVTIEVRGDMTRIYLSETSGRGVTVRNKYTGRVLEMRSPGLIITVGPELFQERKATRQEAAAFRALFRRPHRQKQFAENNPRLLSAPGTLPYTTGITVAQLDEANRNHEVAYVTPMNPSSGQTQPGIASPVVPVQPDQPSVNPEAPGNPVTPPVIEPTTPVTPENPPSVPDVPAEPDTPENPPATPDVPAEPDVPPLDPGITPIQPDTPANPSAYKVTMPELAGNFAGSGTFNFYNLADPTAAYGSARSGNISFTVPLTYVSLQNDVYTINLTDVKVPGFQNGAFSAQQANGHDLQVNVNRQSGAITQAPGQTITTSPDEIRALLIRGAFTDNQKGQLDTVHFTAGTGAGGEALRGRNQGSINITKH